MLENEMGYQKYSSIFRISKVLLLFLNENIIFLMGQRPLIHIFSMFLCHIGSYMSVFLFIFPTR